MYEIFDRLIVPLLVIIVVGIFTYTFKYIIEVCVFTVSSREIDKKYFEPHKYRNLKVKDMGSNGSAPQNCRPMSPPAPPPPKWHRMQPVASRPIFLCQVCNLLARKGARYCYKCGGKITMH